MLPILPVLLLLLFQGPANLERMALEGRLPAAIEAIQRMDCQASADDREAFASLIAASKDPDLTHALFTILRWVEQPTESRRVASIPPEPEARIPIETRQSMSLEEGFQASQRSRDGPALFV